ncbi:MAG: cupin domain-containing protein [Betaproteobacteria bacterium]|nr:cupin domain-containing protein [Betaproteobacteria bacterium]
MVRRVVTGHDQNGKAIVLSDGDAPFVMTNPARPGYVSTDIWRTNATPTPMVAQHEEPTLGPRRQMPEPNGTVFRINRVMPETSEITDMTPEQSKKLFAALGNETASTFHKNKRHPLMHRTQTIDYVLILSGEIYCVLDDTEVLLKAGDTMIQCGTNHAWSNRSNAPCDIAFILIDGKFAPELAKSLEGK